MNVKDNKLRKKAEDLVRTQFNQTQDKSEDIDELLYELRVHQIELEIQNEELMGSSNKV